MELEKANAPDSSSDEEGGNDDSGNDDDDVDGGGNGEVRRRLRRGDSSADQSCYELFVAGAGVGAADNKEERDVASVFSEDGGDGEARTNSRLRHRRVSLVYGVG